LTSGLEPDFSLPDTPGDDDLGNNLWQRGGAPAWS